LKALPTDLLEGNYSLEQLTFQGVNLIIPENESQWSFLMVDLNRFKSLYCPNLLSLSEAKAVFQRFDTSKNNILDYKELQQLNAYLFKSFPRLGDETSESVLPADTDDSNPSDKKFSQYTNIFSSGRSIMLKIFKCVSLTYLDLSFQSIRKITSEIKALKNLKVLKLAYCVYLETLSSSLGLLKLNELDLTGCLSLKTPPPEVLLVFRLL
jgi:Leucine-rich repeat (LRR) protein